MIVDSRRMLCIRWFWKPTWYGCLSLPFACSLPMLFFWNFSCLTDISYSPGHLRHKLSVAKLLIFLISIMSQQGGTYRPAVATQHKSTSSDSSNNVSETNNRESTVEQKRGYQSFHFPLLFKNPNKWLMVFSTWWYYFAAARLLYATSQPGARRDRRTRMVSRWWSWMRDRHP